ncbi:MAG: hypothetical protein QOF41_1897 [Methylobacteriaceae bacterium]|nr:hypothetical protein [Methylobacteriaceae bacterium]
MMKIDWHRPAHPTSVAETTSVLRKRRPITRPPSGLESAGELAFDAPRTNSATEHEQVERLSDALASVKSPVPAADTADAHENVVAGARSGLAKLNQGESPANFTFGEHVGLEAVIITNGQRPSLFIRDGFVDLHSPDIGEWEMGLARFESKIRQVITSVGRIDIPVRPWFVGTCFVISDGLVLTNRHVLEVIATQDSAGAWALKWPQATTVDFVGEDGATTATKFKITGVAFAGPDPINETLNFAHLDIAVLRVDPASDAAHTFPEAVTFETDVAQPKAESDLYVVGFPGQPGVWLFNGVPMTGTETTQVISTIFNSKFGIKRLAPGSIKAGPGQVASDSKSWICAHDASTLGGNSGSCVADLSGDGFRVVALHFAGVNREQNWAHVAARLHDHLADFSATFVA